MSSDGRAGGLIGRWVALPVLLRLGVPLGMMAVLWWLSSRSPTERAPSQLRAFLHNGVHVVAYGALAAGWLLALVRSVGSATRLGRTVSASFLLAVGYGLVDEVHQSFVPGRMCSFADLMTDAAGAILALSVLRARLTGGLVPWGNVAIAAGACLACVAFATWGPW